MNHTAKGWFISLEDEELRRSTGKDETTKKTTLNETNKAAVPNSEGW